MSFPRDISKGEDDQDNLFVLESSPIREVMSTLTSPLFIGCWVNPFPYLGFTQIGVLLFVLPLARCLCSKLNPITRWLVAD